MENKSRQLSDRIVPKLVAYFVGNFGAKEYRNGWYKMDCPHCGAKDKYGFNLDQNRTNCFVCGYNKKPLDCVVDIESLKTRVEAWVYLKAFEDLPYYYKPEKAIERKEVVLPDTFTLISMGDGELGKLARNYMKGRGYNITNLTLSGIGYCIKGDYAGYIIFPFYKAGRLIYFIGRKFFNHSGPKIKNPPLEDFGIGKNQLIYNIDSLLLYRETTIMESITNCLTLNGNSTGILGKVISNYQINIYLQSPLDRITIIYDYDAYDRALDLALKLSPIKPIRLVKLPPIKKDDGSYWDVNDFGRKKTLEFKKATPFKTYREFYKDHLELANETSGKFAY